MMPPEVLSNDAGESPPAVSSRLATLTKRRNFQRAARGRRVAMPGFVLQVYERPQGEAEGLRVGYTCSRKVGNAVARNRAKRRLREIARLALPELGRPGRDYVLIGRRDTTAQMKFETLQADLAKALAILHGSAK